MFESDGIFAHNRTLLIDGDIAVYRPCCVHNEDDPQARQRIASSVKGFISRLLQDADCDSYHFFVTPKQNFRDMLVDDYKGNRQEVERPVNLAWAKRWAMDNLQAKYVTGLEADDLLGIYQTDNTVIWSLDKDLRQIAGKHLDEGTRKVIQVSKEGTLVDRGKKIYFDGLLGFYYQLLIGDNTDNILGCAMRVDAIRNKTDVAGNKIKEKYLKRKGIGPKKAYEILLLAYMKGGIKQALIATAQEYAKIHGKAWQAHIETQANLLFMVREMENNHIKRWTFDGRDEWMNLSTGVMLAEVPDE